MKIHVYTKYYHAGRTLIIEPERGDSLKIYGDPSKALVFFILAGHKVKPARAGFITEISDEELTALKTIAKCKPGWRILVKTGLIEEPTVRNILSSLLIEKAIQ